MNNKTHMRLTAKAVGYCNGSQSELAKRMMSHVEDIDARPIRQGHVANWLYGRRDVSPYMAVFMELATEGLVKREQFHLELYERRVSRELLGGVAQ